jgi:hypothetical protein
MGDMTLFIACVPWILSLVFAMLILLCGYASFRIHVFGECRGVTPIDNILAMFK